MSTRTQPPEISRVTRSKAAARRYYDRMSRWYGPLLSSWEAHARQRGLHMLAVQTGQRVLEIGVGPGRDLIRLAFSAGESMWTLPVDVVLSSRRMVANLVSETWFLMMLRRKGEKLSILCQQASRGGEPRFLAQLTEVVVKEISRLSEGSLKWVQPNFSHTEYELLHNNELAATLRLRSLKGTLANAESADGSWTFKRVGFFKTRVTIRSAGSEEETAVFHNNTWKGGGTLEMPDGQKFYATTNFWGSKWSFQTEEEQPLIHFNNQWGLILSSDVLITPAAVHLPELPLLVLLGWYLFVMMYLNSAVAIASPTG